MLDVKAKYQFYAGNAKPDLADCDSLLFTSLLEGSRPSNFDITRFRDKKGAWHRNIAHDCYDKGKSGSTVSRDMFLGLYWFCWLKRKRKIMEELLDYGFNHVFIMGKGETSRTFLTPNMVSTACHLVQALGGKVPWYLKPFLKTPMVFPSDNKGYEAHLAVLHMLLRKDMGLGSYRGHFEAYKKAQPRNALFQYAAGNYHAAKEILMDTDLFPDYRMPSAKDRKEPWLWQRDHGESWRPLNSNKIHTGGDFLFVAYLILRDLKLL